MPVGYTPNSEWEAPVIIGGTPATPTRMNTIEVGLKAVSDAFDALEAGDTTIGAATPADGDVLTYDTTTGWGAAAPTGGGGGATDLDDLTDVDVSTVPPTDGQALVFDTADNLWKPATVSGGGGASDWGDIGGTLADQTDLQGALNAKAPLASPALTGTPTVPTATTGTNTTQAASTAFVKAALDALIAAAPGTLDTLDELAAALGDDANFASTMTTALAAKAALASPTFTGDPKAPTPSPGDNDTSIATTAFVTAALAALTPAKQQTEFSQGGTLTTGTGVFKIPNGTGATRTIHSVWATVGTAPTGAAILVDANLGGTTIFTNQANRPTIAVSTDSDQSGTPDVTSWAAGALLTIDIDQIGSTVAGANLVVTVVYS